MAKIPGGFLSSGRTVVLTSYRDTQVGASSSDEVVGSFVLPFPAKIVQFAYGYTAAGSSSTITNLQLLQGSTDVISATAPTAGSGTQSGLVTPTTPLKEYDGGTFFTVELDTAANSTVDDAAFAIVIQPVQGV